MAATTATPSTIDTGQGVELTLDWHEPAGDVRGVAVVAPGVAVPSRVVRHLAEALADAGWVAVRFDFPGVGASPIPPDRVPGDMVDWARRDLVSVLRVARERAGDRPVVHVGHSAGAWLLGLDEEAAGIPDAVVAIASMSGAWRGLKRSSWPQVLPGMYVGIPVLSRLTGMVPAWAGLGEDAPGGPMRQWASWCRRPGFFFDDPDVATHYDRITAPVRVVLATDDEWATLASSRAVWDRTGGPTVYVLVDPADHDGRRIGHMGLVRQRFASSIWSDAIDWLDEVVEASHDGAA